MVAWQASFLLALGLSVAAQDLSIPSSWLNSTSTRSRLARETIAYDAAATLVSHIDPSSGSAPGVSGYQVIGSQSAVLAQQDWLSGNRTWENTVTSNIQVFTQNFGVSGSDPKRWSDVAYWSLVYFYAYKAYGHDDLLSSTVSAWTDVYDNAFISDADVSSGAGAGTAGRNLSYGPLPGCTEDTIAGGVFYTDIANGTVINGETAGPFMAASAYLYETTQNSTYKSVALLSLDFMINHLWNGTIIYDSFDPRTCLTADTAKFWTYNQAWFIEGLSIMANVTNNRTLTDLLDTVVQSTTTFPSWTMENGVISEGSAIDDPRADRKAWYVRGLAEAWRRNPGTNLAKYIESYISVQYDSILSNSRASGTNYYVPSWFGPSNSSFNALGNLAALDVFNAAFSFVNHTSTGPGRPPPPDSRNDGFSKDAFHAGVIAGGVVGALVALAIVGVGFWLHRRRARCRLRAGSLQQEPDSPPRTRGNGLVVVEPLDGHGTSDPESHPYTLIEPLMAMRASTSGGIMPVTVGQQSKMDRYNVSSESLSEIPLSEITPAAPPSFRIGDEPQRTAPRAVQNASEEIPGLVQRLNSLLQASGRSPVLAPVSEASLYDEAPPQYEREVQLPPSLS